MALATGLRLKLDQKLKLAPQLRQAIAMLQLNRLELREHIEQILEGNPLLELEAEESDGGDDPETVEPESEYEERDRSGDEIDFDREEYSWNDLPEGFSEVQEAPDYDRFIADPQQDTLNQHLLWQVNLSGFSETDEAIARAIVYALDDDGYLHDDIQTLRASLAPEFLVSPEEVEAVLERVQHFEPVGVAARSIRECLQIQIRALPSHTPRRGLADYLVQHHLDELAAQDIDRLVKRSGFETADVVAAVALIRSLDPRPGLRFSRDNQDYVVPDAFIHPDGDSWKVTLNRQHQPTLRINRAYSELIGSTSGTDRAYLKEQLQQAQWLISSLELRNQTLSGVIHAIVCRQTAFMERGEVAMMPLLQKEIAAEIEVHESTVSRATTGKYIHTPRGTFELKHFFSVAIPTIDGKTVSATAVKATLERLIREEDPDQPLSDQVLVEQLAECGLLLARRTVAKYREQLGIPNSSQRRRRGRASA
jgi:RNA polymerase sigma-54 factor